MYSMRDSQRSADQTKSIPCTHRNVTLMTKNLRYDHDNDKYDADADDLQFDCTKIRSFDWCDAYAFTTACAMTSSTATRTKRPLDVDDDAAALDDDDFGLGHS